MIEENNSLNLKARCKEMKVVALSFCFSVILIETAEGVTSQDREKRMVLGKKVKISEWPFTVWMVKKKDAGYPRYCGGSLIEDRWIVTAAHCVDTIIHKPWMLSVRIGSAKRLWMRRYNKFHYEVSKIFLYPGYRSNVIPNDDIALLLLSRPVSINRYTFIRPIRIGLWRIQDHDRESYNCRAAGWGKYKKFKSITELQQESSKPSKTLMAIRVPLIPKDRCISSFDTGNGTSLLLHNKTIFWKKMMCGGSLDPTVGTACLHDSGSPLVCKNKYGNVDLHGITIAIHGPEIRSQPCAPGKQIIVFLRISYYAQWIMDVVNKYRDYQQT